ncbi:MAG: hypothetical protein KAJ32_01090 [Gammaproteobacteria bacterium]|nr:hypothetical protein [Gammaproteobacteria bacterium]
MSQRAMDGGVTYFCISTTPELESTTQRAMDSDATHLHVHQLAYMSHI